MREAADGEMDVADLVAVVGDLIDKALYEFELAGLTDNSRESHAQVAA